MKGPTDYRGMNDKSTVQQLLHATSAGDKSAMDQLFSLVYADLRRLADSCLRRERPDHTLQCTALVHEAYLRLRDAGQPEYQDRTHFLRLAVRVMRQVLVDHARRRNVGKRLVKSPKVYVRDSGIAHALLGIRDKEALLSHPVAGQTWESFIIETLIAMAPDGTKAHYYRTSNGTEVDLVLILPGGKLWAIEVKRSSAPRTERGFHSACADLEPQRRFVVYPGTERFPLDDFTEAISVVALAKALQSIN